METGERSTEVSRWRIGQHEWDPAVAEQYIGSPRRNWAHRYHGEMRPRQFRQK